MPEFSAADWLGYSMNMVGTTPLDTNSATKAVQNARRILTIDDATRDLEVDGVTYKVSKSISVLENKGTTSDFVTYPTGNEAATAFRNDSRLAALFMSITGDPSVAIATEKHHRRNVQYAYYCYSQGKYLAFLKDYADSLNETSILAGIRGLPTPFNGENQDVLQKYKDFFQRFGTHVITKVNYGAHLQLHVWGSNSKPEVNNAWSSDVKADYDGIPSGGDFDANIRDGAQFIDYLGLKQHINSIYGGDGTLAKPLVTAPTYTTFEKWRDTSDQNTSLLSFVVVEIWSLMKGSLNDEISAFGPRIQQAFEWIVDHPKVYKTAVSLVIESDWAEFGLLTPSAVIIKGDVVPELTQYNEMKLTWGKERSHDYKRQQVEFYVVNDGYPIDFYISHGSGGGAEAKGNARVTMEGQTYINDSLTDDNYNTMWFYQKEVSSVPVDFSASPNRSTDTSAWDNTLEQYLHRVYSGY